MSKCGARPRYGIDFVRRERQDRALDFGVRQPFERGQEEPRVGRQRLDVGVGGGRRAACGSRVGRDGGEHRLGRRRQPGDARRRHTHPQPAGRRLQDRAKRERTGGVGRHWQTFGEAGTFNFTRTGPPPPVRLICTLSGRR